MALQENTPYDRVYLTANLVDISTASSAFVACPVRGRIVKAWSVIYGAITAADAIWTMEINNTAVTGVSVTIANASSAAGDVDEGTPTSETTNRVLPGDRIEFVSDGASSTAIAATFTVAIDVY